jgi:hypothetical protein
VTIWLFAASELGFAPSPRARAGRHLKQGILGALSVRGELEAWQEQFAYLKSLTGRYSASPRHNAIIEQLMTLSLDSRTELQRARVLMREYAGPKYRINLLPLFPLRLRFQFLER